MFLIVLVGACVLAVVLAAVRMFGPTTQERRGQVLRFDRWLRERQVRRPVRLWIEVIVLGIALGLLAVWLSMKLSPATLGLLGCLTWGTWR